MKTLIALGAACLFTFGAPATAHAGNTDALVECNDGTLSQEAMGACSTNGGRKVKSAPVPIQATKGATPIDARTGFATNKTKVATATTKKKKSTASVSRTPTAKCVDGAMYFSRERRGACAKHGGVDKWYGW